MRQWFGAALATILGVSLAGPAAGQAGPRPSPGDTDSGDDAARVSAVIRPGTIVRPGAIRRSPNGRFQLQMQRDGNFVLYRRATRRALWASDTSGHRRAKAAMQRDGNLVVYTRHRKPVFSTTTHGHRGARMRVQNDGNLVIRGPRGRVLWTRWREVYRIWTGHRIRPGVLVRSPNRKYRLMMQRNGNLVLRKHTTRRWRKVWSSRTAGYRGAFAELGRDGNFAVYGPRRALWATNTGGNGRVLLAVQNNGNVVMYKRTGPDPRVLWQTHTGS